MKLLPAILLFTIGLTVGSASGQETVDEVMNKLEAAIAEGKVDPIIRLAGSRLDVSILGEGRNYSRSQAEFVLAQFFSTHRASSFRFTASSEAGKGKFVEGLYYSHESRRPFRIYVRLSKKGDDWELREFSVERSSR